MLKKLLYRRMLPKLISRSCGPRVANSGPRAQAVNCFDVALDREGHPHFIATGYENQILVGLKWDGNRYGDDHRIELSEIDIYSLRITHYYGLDRVIYNSIYSIGWHYLTKHAYIKIKLRRKIESGNQYFFNKRKLVTKRRMELLQFMIDDQLSRSHDGINSIKLMTKLYSIYWVSHPSGDEQERVLEFYLSSLVDSGDLKKVGMEYVVQGKAVSTIEKYEEEERRHTEQVKTQRKIALLTLILALAAIVQAGLIKLPVWFDFTK
jgi:hypothetical protein